MRKIAFVCIALFLIGCSPIPETVTASIPTPVLTQVKTIPTVIPQSLSPVTPSVKEQCPKENPSVQPPDFEKMETAGNYSAMGGAYLKYLNSGGVVDVLADQWKPAYSIDLTGDNMPELIVQELQPWHLFIYSCKNGKYQSLSIAYEVGRAEYPKVIAIADANQNGKPELITLVSRRTQGVTGYDVFEWNGKMFSSIVYYSPNLFNQDISSNGPFEDLQIVDLNEDREKELVWSWGIPFWTTYVEGLPFRKRTTIYTWNGQQYILQKIELAPPEYRFQAVQDGDIASISGEYEKAIGFYQHAIQSDKLDWWSLERRNYEQSAFPVIKPTPLTSMKPDPKEHPSLIAYSWYRIMLIDIVTGQLDEAKSIYARLKKNYSAGAGHIYAEMAKSFWKEYDVTKDVQSSCEAAINVANQNPKQAFEYIGYYYEGSDDYHGDDSNIFFPEDICPFN